MNLKEFTLEIEHVFEECVFEDMLRYLMSSGNLFLG